MTSSDFLQQCAEVEHHIYSLAPGSDKKGVLAVLENLKSTNRISDDVLQMISTLWRVRNKVVRSVGEISVDPAVVEKLQFIKQRLHRV